MNDASPYLLTWWRPWGQVALCCAAVVFVWTAMLSPEPPAFMSVAVLMALWAVLGAVAAWRSCVEGRDLEVMLLFSVQSLVAVWCMYLVPSRFPGVAIFAFQITQLAVFQRFFPALATWLMLAGSMTYLFTVLRTSPMPVTSPWLLLVPPATIFAWSRSLRASALAQRRAESLVVDLKQSNEMLERALSTVDELATVRERSRMAKDLHDSIGHALTTTHVFVQCARPHVTGKAGLEALDKAQAQNKAGLRSLRECIAALREQGRSSALSERLRDLVDRFASEHVRADFRVLGKERALDPTEELALFRTVQESLTNVVKHAGATRVDVTLRFAPTSVSLEVIDNGKGKVVPSARGTGLEGLKERLTAVGGCLNVTAAPGGGFALKAIL